MMKLSLDEIVMLSSADVKHPCKKSDILLNAMTTLPKQHNYLTLSLALDELVKRGLMELTKNWQYRLTIDGAKAFKADYQALQLLMLKLHHKASG